MIVYAIRHGKTEFNAKHLINGQLEDPLIPEGFAQVEAVASSVPKSIKQIYSSSLLRAKQTAEILNKGLNAKISLHDELKEICFGTLEGTDWSSDVKEKHRSLKFDWHAQNGESVEDVTTRLLKILKTIKATSNDGEALIVTHGGIIRLLYFLEHKTLLEKLDNALLFEFDLDKIIG